MTCHVGTDDGSKEFWVMPLDSGNGDLASYDGIRPCPHQLHGQVTVGMIACGKHQARITSAVGAPNQEDGRDTIEITAWGRSDASRAPFQELIDEAKKTGYFHYPSSGARHYLGV